MKLVAHGINVDAGIIMVGCLSYLDTIDKRKDMNGVEVDGDVFDVPNGKYDISWKIKNTWNGSIRGHETIEVTSGKIFICDPCYIIGNTTGKGKKKKDTWLNWLHEDYWRSAETNQTGDNNLISDKVFCIDEMGGDGEYKVELSLTKVKEIA